MLLHVKLILQGIIMAFLRKGLVTNRGSVPSTHTRQQKETSHVFKQVQEPTDKEDDAQPVLHIRKVKRIISFGATAKDANVVELECGHTTLSRSTFQGYCKKCK